MATRRTRSQERIFLLLQSLNRAISAQELYAELRNRQENMGLATVYRALEVLKLQGEVQARILPTGESLYSSVQHGSCQSRRCGADRHHLTCINCGNSIALNECPVHDLEHHLEAEHQFKVFYHNLEFFGLCDRCQTNKEVAV